MQHVRTHSLFAALCGLVITFATASPAAPSPTVPATAAPDVRDLFVPVGFDSNDDVVAVVDGYLDGVCYHLRQPKVDTDLANHKIKITVMAVRIQEFCHPIAVRYHQVVHLGALPVGTYRIETQGAVPPQSLVVKQAENPGPDDFPYASVENTTLQLGTGGELSVRQRGHYSGTCQRLNDVRVTRHGRTIDVLPILKLATRDDNGQPCRAEEQAFQKQIALPHLENGRYLLHVRTTAGQSLNEVFDYPYPWDDRDH